MLILNKIKNLFTRKPAVDVIEVCIFGVHAKLMREMPLPTPHEVSVYIPRLEINKKVTENNITTETSMVLNSLTIVSAPRHELSGHPSGVKQTKIILSK